MSESGRSPIVLIVDDEAAVRAVARRALEREGYRAIEASTGADGLTRLEGDAPVDLLLADLNMPEMGGEEMVRRVRAKRPDLKVLYVTGHIGQLMDERPLWKGEAFLEKPYTASQLLEAVAMLLYGTLKRPGPAP